MKPVCLVLGGSGFLGTDTIPTLNEYFMVVAASRQARGPGFRAVDIRDPEPLESLVREVNPDVVVSLAAYRDPDFCEDHPEETRRLNTYPYEHLNQILPATTPLLFVSTDYVFDGDHPPYEENAPRNPVNEYGRSKQEAEDLVLSRPNAIVLRVPLLMGWTGHVNESGFFSNLLHDVKKAGPIFLDDALSRYPVWTRDVGGAIALLLRERASGIIHYSTSTRWTRYRAAVKFAEWMGVPAHHLQPSREIIPRRAARPIHAALSMAKWHQRGYPLPREFPDVARLFLRQFNLTG